MALLDDIDTNVNYGNGPIGTGSYMSRSVPWDTNTDRRWVSKLMELGQDQNNIPTGAAVGTTQTSPTETPYGIDLSTYQYLSNSLKNAQNPPPFDQLGLQDIYPTANNPIEVGTFSSPLLSGSLFSAGAPQVPYEMIYAKQRARAAKDAERDAKIAQQVTYEKAHLKNALQDRLFSTEQDKAWNSYLTQQYDNLKKNNVAPEYWYDAITKSQGYKEMQGKFKNFQMTFDANYDAAADAIDFYNKQKSGDADAANLPYVSYTTYKKAMDFMDKLGKEDIDWNDKDFLNFDTRYRQARNMDKVIETYGGNMNKEVTSSIMKAMADGKLLNTDMNDVYTVMEVGGWNPDKKETRDKIKSIYDAQYGVMAKEDPGSVPDFETEFFPAFKDYLYQTQKQELKTISKTSPIEWAKLRLEEKKAALEKVVIPKTEEKSLTVPGDTDEIWSIPKNKQSTKVIWVASGTMAKIYNPYTGKVENVPMKEGYYKPTALRKSKSTGDVSMDYVPVQQVPMRRDDGTYVLDQNGKPYMTFQETQNYSINAPYSLGQSAIETGGDIQFKDPPDIIHYTQRKGGGTQTSTQPRIGEVQDGYRFKGGDPSKQENWEAVK